MIMEFVLQVVVIVATSITAGFSVYVAIKTDLAKALITADFALKSAQSAHERINDFYK